MVAKQSTHGGARANSGGRRDGAGRKPGTNNMTARLVVPMTADLRAAIGAWAATHGKPAAALVRELLTAAMVRDMKR